VSLEVQVLGVNAAQALEGVAQVLDVVEDALLPCRGSWVDGGKVLWHLHTSTEERHERGGVKGKKSGGRHEREYTEKEENMYT
jgi:hypothetical protein